MKAGLLVALGAVGLLLSRTLGDGSAKPSGGAAPPPSLKPKTGRVLLLGDSLMVGTAPFVSASAKVGVAKVGMTLGEMLSRIKSLPANGFDAVVISGGLNDLAMPSTGDQIATRAQAIWQVAKDRGWKVAHLALSPFGGGAYASRMSETERRRANEQMRAVAGSVSILPADDLLDDAQDSSRLDADFASPDKLHLNATGYELLADLVDEWIRQTL